MYTLLCTDGDALASGLSLCSKECNVLIRHARCGNPALVSCIRSMMALGLTARQQVLTGGRLQWGFVFIVNSACSLPVVSPSWITDPPTAQERSNTKARSLSCKEPVLVLGMACWGFAIYPALLGWCVSPSSMATQRLQSCVCLMEPGAASTVLGWLRQRPFQTTADLKIWAGHAFHMSLVSLFFSFFFLFLFVSCPVPVPPRPPPPSSPAFFFFF